ncbi:unnamed protein product [Rotaria sp. Silwood2]|nr:unnamed protein product [Rotaria sp. Silwood2]CAF3140685.1 unnamed protein product [Rotaria sp. Silwood2]CAF3363139.1 unnamed protein product [Rotaria sp. Silwood2]CAF4488998.1 unnamed protein product [Rotaria sp. Silwood2]CAF4496607.1 unnamed protein product [Rotaria sp. Silwood2]
MNECLHLDSAAPKTVDCCGGNACNKCGKCCDWYYGKNGWTSLVDAKCKGHNPRFNTFNGVDFDINLFGIHDYYVGRHHLFFGCKCEPHRDTKRK